MLLYYTFTLSVPLTRVNSFIISSINKECFSGLCFYRAFSLLTLLQGWSVEGIFCLIVDFTVRKLNRVNSHCPIEEAGIEYFGISTRFERYYLAPENDPMSGKYMGLDIFVIKTAAAEMATFLSLHC